MRVALYARVSTEEQARHGISIEAQLAALEDWAKANGHTVVDRYVDNGISARKPPSKRPELQRLLRDLPERKIELVAFCKLDRWTRNVKGYYQVQETLDKNKVAWIAIQEDYETITASGRFKVNIMLSVAENEADRTSERIKTVLEYKAEKGEAITKSQPLGYQILNGKVVPNEKAQAARDAFQMFANTGNIYAVQAMLLNRHGLRVDWTSVSHFLRNPMYIGTYRGNTQYCEPIIPQDLFDQVQNDLANRPTRKTASGKIYLFSGLIVCAECGRRFYGMTVGTNHRERYRCTGRREWACDNVKSITEYEIERHLLDHLSSALADHMAEVAVKQASAPTVNRQTVERKIERLKDLYIDGDISKEDYKAKKESLDALLREAPRPKHPKSMMILGKDFETEYSRLNRTQKRAFWRSVLDHITIDKDSNVQIFFA